MASDLTDYAANKILDHILGKTTFTIPTVYVALTTSAINESATELSGNGLTTRPAFGTSQAAASARDAKNGAEISWPAATANWGTVTGFSLWDSPTPGAGNRLIKWRPLTATQTVNQGGTFRFPAGNIDVSVP